MRKAIIVFVFTISIIFLTIPDYAHAMRPMSTEDATVLERGEAEVEFGFEYGKMANDDDNYSFTLVPNYGLTDNIQLCAELPFDIIRPEEGGGDEDLSDITLAAKTLVLAEQDNFPSLALKTAVKLSNGDEDDGFGSGDEDVTLILAATKSFGSWDIHGNAGYSFVGDDEDAALNDKVLYGIGARYSLCSKFDIVGEIYGEGDSDFDTDTHLLSPLIGLRYAPVGNVTLDTAFKISIQEDQKTEYGVIAGATISF